jgi:hypothetical protein
MNSNNASSTGKELSDQSSNPTDILSLLLLVGGDIVQKAIAQLVGFSIRKWPGKSSSRVSIVPVAFSFGWVACGFSHLLSAIGDRKLIGHRLSLAAHQLFQRLRARKPVVDLGAASSRSRDQA